MTAADFYVELRRGPSLGGSLRGPLLAQMIRTGEARRIRWGTNPPAWPGQPETPSPTTPRRVTAAPTHSGVRPPAPADHVATVGAARAEGARQERDRILGIIALAVSAAAPPSLVRRLLLDPSCTPERAARIFLEVRRLKADSTLAALAGDEAAMSAPAPHGWERESGPAGVPGRVLGVTARCRPEIVRDMGEG